MDWILNFDLTTPASIFPAISLLMLAYTNRFVVLAELIRDLYDDNEKRPKQETLDQIKNLSYRMKIIKNMQVCGAVSFILAAFSMLLTMLSQFELGLFIFGISLVVLITSLLFLLRELSVSIDALTIQLKDLTEQNK